MRASLLAVIAIAIIAGLGVVFAVKALGLLEPPRAPEPVVVVQQPPPVVVARPVMPRVIAPTRNIFAGDAMMGDNLSIRFLREDELKDYEANKADYMPPSHEATLFRLAARDLPGDRPLRKGDLLEAKKPDPLNVRLFPGTRAIDLGVMKDRSAGGLIQVGDWVDIYMSTDVGRTDRPDAVPFTTLLVPHAQVIAKRNSLYPIYAPLAEGKPVEYTLATNPYRAALLEHARSIGVLSMTPVSSDEKKRLDGLRDEAMKNPGSSSVATTFAPPGSPEFQAEEDRIKSYQNGSLVIGDETLVNILKLPAIEPPPPPPRLPKPPKVVKVIPAPPPPPPVTVELFSGVNKSGTATFPVPYTPQPPTIITEPADPDPPYIPPPPAKYIFRSPTLDKPKAAAPGK
jgi:Flp pilus assembly protein CpaB